MMVTSRPPDGQGGFGNGHAWSSEGPRSEVGKFPLRGQGWCWIAHCGSAKASGGKTFIQWHTRALLKTHIRSRQMWQHQSDPDQSNRVDEPG